MMPIPYNTTYSAAQTQYTIDLGYNNASGASIIDDHFYLYYKRNLDSVATTKVGIHTTVAQQPSQPSGTAYEIGPASRYLNGIYKVSVVGQNPDRLSGTGVPAGFDKTKWTLQINGNEIECYTTDAGQKSILSTSETYWFAIESRSDLAYFWAKSPLITDDVESTANFLTDDRTSFVRTYFQNGYIFDINN